MSGRAADIGMAPDRSSEPASATWGVTPESVVRHVERILARPLHRVHIIGGPGSGKTSLAVEVAALTKLPVHHLDDIARVGGGDGPVREAEERDRLLATILATDGWVTEGVHLGWTDPVFHDADLIVWLDYVTWPRAARRIFRRFVSGALHEMRARPAHERFTRFGDYAHSLRRLGGAMVESRRYYSGTQPNAMPPDGSDAESEALLREPGKSGTWSMAADAVAAYQSKLVHCRRPADVDELIARLR